MRTKCRHSGRWVRNKNYKAGMARRQQRTGKREYKKKLRMQKHRTKQNMAGNKNWNTGDEQTQTKQHQEENRKCGGDTRSREETKVE